VVIVIVIVVVSSGGESDEKEERESKERSHVESGYCEFNGFVHGCGFIQQLCMFGRNGVLCFYFLVNINLDGCALFLVIH